MPQLRGGTLPNVARIGLGSQLQAFQGTVFCHRRHLLSDYKSSRKAFSSLMKKSVFFYLECEFKAELQGDCSPPLFKGINYSVWTQLGFVLTFRWGTARTATPLKQQQHTPKQKPEGEKETGQAASLLNCLLRTRQTRTTKQVPVLPFTQHSWHLSGQKVGQLQPPPEPRGANWQLSTQLKVKQTCQERRLCCSKENLRRINQSCLYVPVGDLSLLCYELLISVPKNQFTALWT